MAPSLGIRASNEGYAKVRKDDTNTEKTPTQAFSWLKAPIRAFTFKTLKTFKTLSRHYGNQAPKHCK